MAAGMKKPRISPRLLHGLLTWTLSYSGKWALPTPPNVIKAEGGSIPVGSPRISRLLTGRSAIDSTRS